MGLTHKAACRPPECTEARALPEGHCRDDPFRLPSHRRIVLPGCYCFSLQPGKFAEIECAHRARHRATCKYVPFALGSAVQAAHASATDARFASNMACPWWPSSVCFPCSMRLELGESLLACFRGCSKHYYGKVIHWHLGSFQAERKILIQLFWT